MLFASALAVAASCANNSQNTAATEQASAIKVETATAIMQDVPQTEVYASTIQANVVNNIAPQSSSRIQKINVEIGDFVNAGQILAEMDQLQLQQAKLKLNNDETEYERVKGLYEEGGVSKSDFDAIELAYKVSKTNYDNLLENTILRAPVSGVITARNYDRGDMFSMGNPIYVVEQITPVKLLVGITEADYTKIKKGDEVSITVDALPGRTFTGKVNRLYPTMDASSHTFTTEIIVANGDRALRPGMYAKVSILFGVNHSVVISDDAFVKMQGTGSKAAYILQSDGTVKMSVVKLGRHFDSYYEVLEGIEDGDVVATKGNTSLRNGSKVEIIK